jgi:hypothetical protein
MVSKGLFKLKCNGKKKIFGYFAICVALELSKMYNNSFKLVKFQTGTMNENGNKKKVKQDFKIFVVYFFYEISY